MATKLPEYAHLHRRGCSQNVPRVIVAPDTFSLITPKGAEWRAKVATAAASAGIDSSEEMGKEYGKRWHWGMRRVVRWMNEVSRAEGNAPGPSAIKDKMLKILGRPRSWYSPEELMTDAELTMADIEHELIEMAPARAAS